MLFVYEEMSDSQNEQIHEVMRFISMVLESIYSVHVERYHMEIFGAIVSLSFVFYYNVCVIGL